MLTDAGVLIVDGVMVTANFANDGNYNVFSSWYKFTPVWQAYLAGNSSNCVSILCPCLDGKTPVCTKEGDSLVSLGGNGLSWFRQQLQDVSGNDHGCQNLCKPSWSFSVFFAFGLMSFSKVQGCPRLFRYVFFVVHLHSNCLS